MVTLRAEFDSCYNPLITGGMYLEMRSELAGIPSTRRTIYQLLSLMLLIFLLAACTGGPDQTSPTAAKELATSSPTSSPSLEEPIETVQKLSQELSPIPPITENDHIKGGDGASVTLLVYSDFQCPYCADFYHAWKQIEGRHPGEVRLVFRHFPLLSIHDKADLAGAASEIASRGGQFWEMHDALFERQDEWKSLSREAFVSWVSQLAGDMGINPLDFQQELLSGTYQEDLYAAYNAGINAGIPGTPFLFFNQDWYRLNPTALNLEASIRLELLKEKQLDEPPLFEFESDSLYFAHLQLDKGELVIQLYPAIAPATVASFIYLAESGYYDGTGFHSVQAGRVVETGDPSGTGLGGPGYLLLDELSDTLSFDVSGMVAMSSSGPNTNGSRYFINLIPLPHLNGARTIFGRVIEGIEILAALQERDPFLDLFEPSELVIHSIRIETR